MLTLLLQELPKSELLSHSKVLILNKQLSTFRFNVSCGITCPFCHYFDELDNNVVLRLFCCSKLVVLSKFIAKRSSCLFATFNGFA